jgi:hypothetical protein
MVDVCKGSLLGTAVASGDPSGPRKISDLRTSPMTSLATFAIDISSPHPEDIATH